MPISYELAKKLKDAGFPQHQNWCEVGCAHDDTNCLINLLESKKPPYVPTLSELIEACGEDFESLIKQAGGWVSISSLESYMLKQSFKSVPTPEEAVANLYLALH